MNIGKIISALIKTALIVFLLSAIVIGFQSCKKEEVKKDQLDQIQKRGKIIAGVKFDSKPFGFIGPNKELMGFDIDLVREIAKRVLGNENAVEFRKVTSSSRIYALTSGSIDLIAATLTINSKRSQIIDFSIPYYAAGQAIMISKDSKTKSIKDLNGKKVGIVLGTTAEKNIRELVPNVIIKGYKTYNDAFLAIQENQLDALTTDDTIIAGFLSEDSRFKMLKERYTREHYGIGFRKSEETGHFQRAVNIALDDIKADGTLEKIRKKWMIEFIR